MNPSDNTIDAEIAYLHRTIEQGGDIRSIEVTTPEELALLFRVSHHTARRWLENEENFPPESQFLTPGGHHRIFTIYVERMLFRSGVLSRRERRTMIENACDERSESFKKKGPSMERQLEAA